MKAVWLMRTFDRENKSSIVVTKLLQSVIQTALISGGTHDNYWKRSQSQRIKSIAGIRTNTVAIHDLLPFCDGLPTPELYLSSRKPSKRTTSGKRAL
jgi:hypothetical protein